MGERGKRGGEGGMGEKYGLMGEKEERGSGGDDHLTDGYGKMRDIGRRGC